MGSTLQPLLQAAAWRPATAKMVHAHATWMHPCCTSKCVHEILRVCASMRAWVRAVCARGWVSACMLVHLCSTLSERTRFATRQSLNFSAVCLKACNVCQWALLESSAACLEVTWHGSFPPWDGSLQKSFVIAVSLGYMPVLSAQVFRKHVFLIKICVPK